MLSRPRASHILPRHVTYVNTIIERRGTISQKAQVLRPAVPNGSHDAICVTYPVLIIGLSVLLVVGVIFAGASTLKLAHPSSSEPAAHASALVLADNPEVNIARRYTVPLVKVASAPSLAGNPELKLVRGYTGAAARGTSGPSMADNPELKLVRGYTGPAVKGSNGPSLADNPELKQAHGSTGMTVKRLGASFLADNPELAIVRRFNAQQATVGLEVGLRQASTADQPGQ